MKYFTLILALILAGINWSCSSRADIVVGSKPHSEQYILANMIKTLIETKTDLSVDTAFGLAGGTTALHPAMLKGDIDIYPEYTGTAWMFVLKNDPILDSRQLYEKTKTAYREEFAITWMGLYGFNDAFGLAMKRAKAQALDIKNYSDLANESSALSFGAEPDFFEREDGYPGLEKLYGFDFLNKKEMDIGLKYQAANTDQVDVINIFTTDGHLKKNEMLVLEDDLNYFPAYQAATLVRSRTLEKFPQLSDVLELLVDLIDGEAMIQMNYLVEVMRESDEKVAADFLTAKGLL